MIHNIYTHVFFYFMFLMDILPQLRRLGKAMCVLLFDVCNGCSTSIKEINRLIWKGMSNIYYWEKLTFSKLRFSRKDILKKCTNFKSKKIQGILGERLYWHYRLQLSFVYKPCLRFVLNRFVRETKGFYQGSFRNEVDFSDLMNVFLNILAKN